MDIKFNPYTLQADEIGLNHSIPGVTYLGDLLTPPGWKLGDRPISPKVAVQLFEEARQEARDSVAPNAEKPNDHLILQETETSRPERVSQWNAKYRLDRCLLEERIYVYQMHEAHEQTKNLHPNIIPHHTFPLLNRIDPRLLDSFSPYTSSGFPTTKSLAHDLKVAYNAYEINQMEIERQAVKQTIDNHRELLNQITRYQHHISRRNLTQGILPTLDDQQPRHSDDTDDTLTSTRSTRRASQMVPRPPAYRNPKRQQSEASYPVSRDSSQTPMYEHTPNATTEASASGLELPSIQELGYSTGDETRDIIEYADYQPEMDDTAQNQQTEVQGTHHVIGYFNYQPETANAAQSKEAEFQEEEKEAPETSSEVNTPKRTPRKWAPKPKVEKKKPWYHEEIAAANLPTSVISDEAIQAGLNFTTKKAVAKKTTTPKRPPKPIIGPAKGFPISEKAAALLRSKGVIDRRITPRITQEVRV